MKKLASLVLSFAAAGAAFSFAGNASAIGCDQINGNKVVSGKTLVW